jgi:hypothetical protein
VEAEAEVVRMGAAERRAAAEDAAAFAEAVAIIEAEDAARRERAP